MMTPKMLTITVIFSLLKCILGASFSNVVVRSGSDVIPVEYINYNAGALPITTSQISQISTAPLESLIPVSSLPSLVSPCVSPCVLPNLPVPAVAPIPNTNARIITYSSPIANVPVIAANKDDAIGYQYAYTVFDDNTGDKKTQSEQSDGSVVQGQYSFIQPDGVRREVIYTADDLKGFNAVVRNISPEPEKSKTTSDESKENKKEALPPCNEVKSEQLKVKPISEKLEDEAQALEKVDQSEHFPDVSNNVIAANSSENKNVPENAVVSYNDVLKCLKAKLQSGNAQENSVSPLTFILFPSLVGSC